jgi:hypothetical protein
VELDYRARFHTVILKKMAPYDNVFKHTTDMCDKEAGDHFHKIQYFYCTNNKKMTLSPHHYTFKSHYAATDNAEAITLEPPTITH